MSCTVCDADAILFDADCSVDVKCRALVGAVGILACRFVACERRRVHLRFDGADILKIGRRPNMKFRTESANTRFGRLPRLVVVAGLLCWLVGCASSMYHPQVSRLAANPSDVSTIPRIIRASYETISGPDGDPLKVRQWDRDRTLYLPGAIYVSNYYDNGKVTTVIQTPEEYRQHYRAGASYETEAGRLIERFGNVAQVRSVSVNRETPDGPITARWVNYFQLYWDGQRWWIAANIWDAERPGLTIPESWIGKFEESSN